MKKLLMILMALVMSIAFVACAPQNTDNTPKKSILNVGVNSGWGTKWVENAAIKFEALYANTSFEPGKTGVDVVLDWGIDKYKPTNLLTAMERYENTLYYVIQHDYASYLGSRLLSSMTEAVIDKVYDEDGELVMVDDGTGKYVQVGDKPATQSMMERVAYGADKYYLEFDNNYYATPWGVNLSCMFYDVELFNQKGYYFGADGKMGKTLSDVNSGNCGKGPDGIMHTADDGMPVTYNDFLALLNKMKTDGVIPFTWAGQTTYQRAKAYDSVWANYEGAENFSINFSADVSEQQMAEAGVTKVYDYLSLQEGRKAGIQFFYDVVKNGYYSENAFTQSGLEAGALYVKSIETDSPIAFCMGASNWEGAVRSSFNELVKETGNTNYAYGKRMYKVFPIPNFVDVQGLKDQTNDDPCEIFPGYYTDSIAFIAEKNSCENPTLQKRLAKLFLQFTSSRTQAIDFMVDSSGTMSMYSFKVKDSELDLFTPYTQDICRYLNEGAKIIPVTEYAEERYAKISFNPTILTPENKTKTYYDVPSAFKENPNLTVEECFKKVQNAVRKLF